MVGTMKRVAVALPLAMLICAASAQAQLNPFKRADLSLSEADLKKMNAASEPLYTAEPPVVGSAGSWTGDNGDFGTVELIEVLEWRGLPCRKLHHIIKIKGVRDPISLTVDRCKTAEGEWKIRY
ncbi:MAG: hypothetical protein GY791_19705 [Alphaproteobacteria bacterium]|nr:hypothetical protein [Alphaproteobacteria bacterium]